MWQISFARNGDTGGRPINYPTLLLTCCYVHIIIPFVQRLLVLEKHRKGSVEHDERWVWRVPPPVRYEAVLIGHYSFSVHTSLLNYWSLNPVVMNMYYWIHSYPRVTMAVTTFATMKNTIIYLLWWLLSFQDYSQGEIVVKQTRNKSSICIPGLIQWCNKIPRSHDEP